jgi:hypothetical protein
MWKAALAGALALVTIGTHGAFAQDIDGRYGARGQASFAIEQVESQIAQLKAMLRLTPSQERHWPRVAAALRDMAQPRAENETGTQGFVQRVGARASAMVANAASIRRLIVAAQPLYRSLDDDQKRVALAVARDMGFEQVAARLQ